MVFTILVAFAGCFWHNRPRRPFGGVNVLMGGDFFQLPPPEGGFLASVPRPLRASDAAQPDALKEQGLALLWESTRGVVELCQRERCKDIKRNTAVKTLAASPLAHAPINPHATRALQDEWWNEVCDQLRAGCLSEANHRYLHGLPVENCTLSPEERASRRRVITGPDDERLQTSKFLPAPAIVANNDAKYQINKDRAKHFAKAAGVPLHWSFAVDKASAAVLQNQALDKDVKLSRLGRQKLQAS